MKFRGWSNLIVVVGCCLLTVGETSACIWIRGTTIEGWYKERSPLSDASRLKKFIDATPEERLGEIYSISQASSGWEEAASDAAVEKLMRGDTKGAVEDLENLEKTRPGLYFTAANLGTAYELSGDNRSALRWILEGIKRDPEAHMRTEWLHARILETKLKLADDPTWLEHHSITGVDFSRLKKSGYKLQTLQGDLDVAAIHKSLWTQLSVRMIFVKPKDPIVAQLLYELALVEAHTQFLEVATQYLNIAGLYGLPEEQSDPLARKWKGIIWLSTNAWIILSIVAGLLMAALVFRKLKRHAGMQKSPPMPA